MQQPQMKRVRVPQEIVNHIRINLLGAMANAVVDGDYDGSEVISDSHKRLIADFMLTMSQNPALETAQCEHCSKIRLEHNLSLENGHRECVHDEEDKAPSRFAPVQRKIVAPPEKKSNIIIPGRG